MRHLAFSMLILSAGTAASAQDADKARAVIDKAIKALGGEEKLEKFKAQTWKEKGTFYGMGEGLPYTGVYAIQWPSQFKMEIENVFTIVLDGDKGWIKSMGGTMEMTKEQVAEQREQHHAGWVSSLAPLKDKAYTLTLLEDGKVGTRPVTIVKVTHKDHRDVKLSFDKETGLLARSEYTIKDDAGKELPQETLLSNYKEVEGIKIPTNVAIHRDGKKFVEAENTDVKPAGKLPAKVFEKP